MKNLVIIFLSILLITGADVRPVFVHLFRALSYAAETSVADIPRRPVALPEETAPKPIKLPFLESPTSSTVEDLTLDQALDEAESIQIGSGERQK